MYGLAGGPSLPVVPVIGSKAVAPATLFVARFERAEEAPNDTGIVLPGRAWMFVNSAGSTNVMLTSAFLLPWICHAPAPAAVGCTVVAMPFGTLPKLRLLKVVTVSAWPMTFASMPTDPVTPCDRPGAARAARATRAARRPAGRGRNIT